MLICGRTTAPQTPPYPFLFFSLALSVEYYLEVPSLLRIEVIAETATQTERNKSTPTTTRPDLMQLFMAFLRLGASAFGGPAMIHYIKHFIVERKRWVDDKTFRDGIVLSQSIPGATAMQIAAFVGLKANGTLGALAAFVAFILPGCLLMALLSVLYVTTRTIPQVIAVMSGLQVIVVALMAHATFSFGKEFRSSYQSIGMALASALLLRRYSSPFAVIAGAAVVGAVLFRGERLAAPARLTERGQRGFRGAAIVGGLAVAGLLVLWSIRPQLSLLALLMMKINVLAFGGGSSTVPLMFVEFVNTRGWLTSKMLIDGIALGQITPGPIVITSVFVGYIRYGLTGAVIATVAMFTPSFFLLLVTAPYFDRLKSWRYFGGASRGILACFVGLLLFVTLRISVEIPWSPVRVALGLLALLALFKNVDVLYVVLIGAVVSVVVL